jgi:hypothetical protein
MFFSGCSFNNEIDLKIIEQRLFKDVDRVVIFSKPENKYLNAKQIENLRKAIRDGTDLTELPQSETSKLINKPNNIVFGLSNIASFIYDPKSGYLYIQKSYVNRDLMQKHKQSQIQDLKLIKKYLIGNYRFCPLPIINEIVTEVGLELYNI